MLQEDIDNNSDFQTLLSSKQVGPCLVENKKQRSLYIFNHLAKWLKKFLYSWMYCPDGGYLDHQKVIDGLLVGFQKSGGRLSNNIKANKLIKKNPTPTPT